MENSEAIDFTAEGTQKIWHYMDFPKFINLLESQSLNFARADSFKDVFEGKIPDFFFKGWSEANRKQYEDAYYHHVHSRRKAFINCWSAHEKESYALWQIYGGSAGIALQTDVELLKSSFIDVQPEISKVHYIDYSAENNRLTVPFYSDRDKSILRKNFFACKSRAYEYENEIRAIVMEEHEESSKLVPVKLELLLKRVYINPFSEEWFARMTADLVRNRYGLKDARVMVSDIEVK